MRTLRTTQLLLVAQAGLAAAAMFLAGLRSSAAETYSPVPTNQFPSLLTATNGRPGFPHVEFTPLRAENVTTPARASEPGRKDTATNARRNLDFIADQLSELGQAYTRELQRSQRSGPLSEIRLWMIAVGVASLSLLLALGFGFAHHRALRRLTAEVQELRARADFLTEEVQDYHEKTPPPARPSSPKPKNLTIDAAAPPTPRADAALPSKRTEVPNERGPVMPAPGSTSDRAPETAQKVDSTIRLELLLGKALSHEDLKQLESALSCYDEALALAPQQAETLVKRGQVLEQLERLDQAIESYDRAVAVDPSLATAHLLKAGVLNRLGRSGEALKCYDLALRSRHNSLAE